MFLNVLPLPYKLIWASTRPNQQSDCAPSEESDQPGHPPSPESWLCASWVAKDPSFLHADSEDSDQTGRMPRLIWVFAGRTLTFLVLSCRGWFIMTTISRRNCLTENPYMIMTVRSKCSIGSHLNVLVKLEKSFIVVLLIHVQKSFCVMHVSRIMFSTPIKTFECRNLLSSEIKE